MKKYNKSFCVYFVLLNLIFIPSSWAGEGTVGDYFRGIGTKFGRGFVNVVTSPAEIPCTTRDTLKDHPKSGYIVGPGRGFVFMVRRILVGASEMATFIIPMDATIPAVCTAESAQVLS